MKKGSSGLTLGNLSSSSGRLRFSVRDSKENDPFSPVAPDKLILRNDSLRLQNDSETDFVLLKIRTNIRGSGLCSVSPVRWLFSPKEKVTVEVKLKFDRKNAAILKTLTLQLNCAAVPESVANPVSLESIWTRIREEKGEIWSKYIKCVIEDEVNDSDSDLENAESNLETISAFRPLQSDQKEPKMNRWKDMGKMLLPYLWKLVLVLALFFTAMSMLKYYNFV